MIMFFYNMLFSVPGTAQAIRPAYIVLAGLGAGNLLLVIIAIVLLCSYPIRGEEGHAPGNIAASSTVAESSNKKREKKPEKIKEQKAKNKVFVAADGDGDIEMSNKGSTVHHEHYVDHSVVETNPYYDQGGHGGQGGYGGHGGHGGHETQFSDDEETKGDHVREVYGNQAEMDNGSTLRANDQHYHEDDHEDSHVF